MRAILALLFIVGGCGRLGFDPSPSVEDDASTSDSSAPDSEPLPSAALAFVSTDWTPSGGPDGADSHCQGNADLAGIPRSFQAVVATTQTISQRLGGTTVSIEEWVDHGGTTVATFDAKALVLTISSPITRQADATTASGDAWVGTEGPSSPGTENCANWESTAESSWVVPLEFDGYWLAERRVLPCSEPRKLYCLQSPSR